MVDVLHGEVALMLVPVAGAAILGAALLQCTGRAGLTAGRLIDRYRHQRGIERYATKVIPLVRKMLA